MPGRYDTQFHGAKCDAAYMHAVVFVSSDHWIGLTLDGSSTCNSCSFISSPTSVIHAECLACRARWSWLDASPITQNGRLLVDKWRYDEPTGGQTCARLSTTRDVSGQWFDVGCDERFGLICKKGEFLIIQQRQHLFRCHN